jgi:lysophospholipid acyltransferase (LPLAT)-like uncharacterized protein
VIRKTLAHAATFWVRSLRPRFTPSPALPASGILVLWHSDMMPCLRAFAGRNMRVLISQSQDGDFGTAAATQLGYRVLRGSSSRGGITALKRLARDLKGEGGWVALVADGPRGPRGVCKPGAAWLSKTCGLPVVGVTAGAPHGITLGGWARVRVPLPFARIDLRLSTPFHPETPEEIDEVMKKLMVEGRG